MINKTTGGTSYKWVFEGGTPSESTLQQPPLINFIDTGFHNISLTVNDGRTNSTLAKKIHVSTALFPGFKIEPSFEDEDSEAPLNATLCNTTISGLTYNWSSTGGSIDNISVQHPDIHFENPGTYTVTLTAANSKQSKQFTQTITVKKKKNLRTFTNIKLGINTAHGSIGSFFSTSLRKTFRAGDNMNVEGKSIDVVYFGLNQNFTYNKFLSPDSASAYTFSAIPGATSNQIINAQELCNCGNIMSSADFDQMSSGSVLQNYMIKPGAEGKKQFNNNSSPRIVLYQTADGRKGAIKIKQFVTSGSQSYIVVDIKIQKAPQ